MGASLDSDTDKITTNKKSNKKLFFQKYIFSKALQLLLVTKRASANGTICQSRKKSTVLDFLRKMCIKSEKRFDFLKELVSTVPDLQGDHDEPLALYQNMTGETQEGKKDPSNAS